MVATELIPPPVHRYMYIVLHTYMPLRGPCLRTQHAGAVITRSSIDAPTTPVSVCLSACPLNPPHPHPLQPGLGLGPSSKMARIFWSVYDITYTYTSAGFAEGFDIGFHGYITTLGVGL